METNFNVIIIFLIILLSGCRDDLTDYGELVKQEEGCPMIINNSETKIISFTIQYLNKNRDITGSGIKTLKPGEAKVLNCEGAISRIMGAIEVAPVNYEQHIKQDSDYN